MQTNVWSFYRSVWLFPVEMALRLRVQCASLCFAIYWHAMGFSFINLAMLLGLAGIALPFLVHLLSRRKFDIVEWGAMQFLELSQKTRRRMRLEELLLMLLRMGLIALIALALARPWISGGIFSRLVSNQARDVVFVVDGSYSISLFTQCDQVY